MNKLAPLFVGSPLKPAIQTSLVASCILLTLFAPLVSATAPPPPPGPTPTAAEVTIHFTIHSILEQDSMDFGSPADFYLHSYIDGATAIDTVTFTDDSAPLVDSSYTTTTTATDFTVSIYAYEDDWPLSNDLVDVSGASGGGADDYSTVDPGAWFFGIYNITTQSWELGWDPITRVGSWWATSGSLDGSTSTDENDATVLFALSASVSPTLLSATPASPVVAMEAWSSLNFSVLVGDPDSTLSYDWVYDGYVNAINSSLVRLNTYASDVGAHFLSVRIYEDGSPVPAASFLWYIDVTPYNIPPVANAGPDRTALALEIIAFDGSNSFDPDGWNLTLSWDFGDGSTGSGEVSYHLYQSPGVYVVTLNASDGVKTTSDTATVTVAANPKFAATTPVTSSLFGNASTTVPTTFSTAVNSSKSWRLNVYENSEYRLFLKFQVVFEYQFTVSGQAGLRADSSVSDETHFLTNFTLLNASSSTRVLFRPQLVLVFSKEWKSNNTEKTYIRLKFGLPSETDLDGSGNNFTVNGKRIYLWDEFVEVYTNSSSNDLGVEHFLFRSFTLFRLDILQLMRQLPLGPEWTFLIDVLDFLLNVYLDFDLDIAADFTSFLYLTEIDPAANTTSIWRLGFNQSYIPSSTQGQSLHTRESRFFVLGQVLASTQTWGSLDLNITLDWAGDLIASTVGFLFGWDTPRSWSYPLLTTQTVSGSSYQVTLQQPVIETWFEAPAAPQGASAADVGTDWANITWTANTQQSFGHYVVTVRDAGSGNVVDTQIVTDRAGARVQISGLAQGTRYTGDIVVVNNLGQESPSSSFSFTTTPTQPVLTLGASNSTRFVVTWSQSSAPAFVRYTVKLFNATSGAMIRTLDVNTASDATATFEGLSPRTTYRVQVTVECVGASSASAPLEVETGIPPPPSAPNRMAATVDATGRVMVTWDPSAGSGAEGYRVTVRWASNGTEVRTATVTGGSVDQASFAGLGPGSYVAEVASIDAFGQTGPVTTSTFSIQAPAGGFLPAPGAGAALVAVAVVGLLLVRRRGRL